MTHSISVTVTSSKLTSEPFQVLKPAEPVNEEPKQKQGRPKKGEEPKKKDTTRLEQQISMTFEEMLKDIPTDCDAAQIKEHSHFLGHVPIIDINPRRNIFLANMSHEIRFDLRTALEDMSDTVAVRAQEKGLELVFLIEPDVPALVRGDPGRLRQILTNLIGNAIKFTRKGKVALHVTLDHEDDATAMIRFAVKNTGIGIPADKHIGDRMFWTW